MIARCFISLILISWVVAFSREGLLSTKKCTWGPAFWCKNITNAVKCNAVRHCIETVWEHQKVPEDNDDVCTICKKMIVQARDQLESNETINEIKEVFEGTCKLIHIKPLIKECTKLADEYAPELVDMLSSQMNPDVICSVAGLCNNADIDKMLEDAHRKEEEKEKRTAELQKDCESCMNFGESIGDKIEKATADEIKSYFLEKCRSLGSFSDSCSIVVNKYSDDLISKVREFEPSSLCYLTSTCVNGFIRKVHVKTESDVGVIHFNNDAISVAVKHLSEDESCDFCKQMVKHLKDVLVSNTTKLEFKNVLRGFCKQTGKFKEECLTFADEYYGKIYDLLVNDLNGSEVCKFVGICPKASVFVNGPIAPLLPEAPVAINESATGNGQKYGRVTVEKSDSNVRVFEEPQSMLKVEISFGDPLESRFQLPIERLLIPQDNDLNVNNKAACEFCQYLLHYIQKAISQPYGENELKKVVNKVCEKLPNSIIVECKNFVEQFGDAFAAILAQEIDPSQVCPALRVCPATLVQDKYEPMEIVGKASCPLCLMAVEEIIDKLKNNKTEEAIRHSLQNLCLKMPTNLKSQCNQFVQNYTEAIVDMLLADFTPQEVCTFLKICHPSADVELVTNIPMSAANYEIHTNQILREANVESEQRQRHPNLDGEMLPTCILCEFIMDKVSNKLKTNFSRIEVERTLSSICHQMPRTIQNECKHFLKKYSHFIIELLMDLTETDKVCSVMHMCREAREVDFPKYEIFIQRGVEECAICEALVGAIRALLQDKKFDKNISKYTTKVCNSFPYSRREKCKYMFLSYGPSIINLLVELEVRPEHICHELQLCDVAEQAKVVIEDSNEESHPQQRPHLLGGNSCTWGPSFWCQSEDHARACRALAHCREMVWKAETPPVPVA